MKRIAIIGLGLIGSSMGLALHRLQLPDTEVVGHDREPTVARRAVQLKAVDRAHWTLSATVQEAQLVIIATPVKAIREVMERVASELIPGAIVTDTASTKAAVLQWAQELLPQHVSFVGGHPMAGSERSGPDAARADLFRGRPYCLIPAPGAKEEAVRAVVDLVEGIEARAYFIDPVEHDSYVAAVSHLPLILSTALVQATSKSPSWQEMARLAATGYRDLTRLASGSPEMSRDICLTNAEPLAHWIEALIHQLQTLRTTIKNGVPTELQETFQQAQDARARWLTNPEWGLGLEQQELLAELPTSAETTLGMFAGDRLVRQMKTFWERTKDSPKGRP